MVQIALHRVLIDTNVLIFGLLPAVPVNDQMSLKERHASVQGEQARAFLAQCHAAGTEVLLSSISVSEALEWLPDVVAGEMFHLISRHFTVLPFDGNVAFRAGRLAFALHNMDIQDQPGKSKVRNDLYIWATGLHYNCTDFYTTDKVLLKQAARLALPMAVHPLPGIA